MADWPTNTFAPPIVADKKVSFPQLGSVMHDGNLDPGDVQAFTDLYVKRIFPLITNKDVERGSREDVIAKLRSDFGRLSRFPGSTAFETLVDITLDYMTKIAVDPKWHPVVRINATLALGEVRSPKAATVLLELIRKPVHPAIKVAAMADLVNLAEHGVLADANVAAPVVGLMVAAARSSPKNPSDSLRWMRGQAADVLGAVGTTGGRGEVFAALVLMLGDEELPLLQRGKAARALGKLHYDNGVPDVKSYAKALAGLGSDGLAANLPTDPRRVRSVARDIQDGLSPLLKQDVVPKPVRDLHDAIEKLEKTAAAAGTEKGVGPDAIAAAKSVCDGISGKK
jgi:hypothetical protein